jgi:hypothetical protein
MAEELAPLVVQSKFDALEFAQSWEAHVSAERLQHTDLDRLARRDLHATDGVGAFKGRGCLPAAASQKESEQKQDYVLTSRHSRPPFTQRAY